MGKRQVTVAAVQMQCTNHPQENLKKAEKMVRQAAAAGAQIILLSELFEREYFDNIRLSIYRVGRSETEKIH